jgi:hypothetical protein
MATQNREDGKQTKTAVRGRDPLTRARGLARDVFRLWQVWVLQLICIWIVHAVAPQQLPILAYKVSVMCTGGLLLFWIDRWLFGKIDDDGPEDWRLRRMWMRVVAVCTGVLAAALAA